MEVKEVVFVLGGPGSGKGTHVSLFLKAIHLFELKDFLDHGIEVMLVGA